MRAGAARQAHRLRRDPTGDLRGGVIGPPAAGAEVIIRKDMRRPRCSVILPTHNRKTLPRAVASVLAQDEPDFELIIVDDGSTDQTQAWLKTLDDPRIRLARSEGN